MPSADYAPPPASKQAWGLPPAMGRRAWRGPALDPSHLVRLHYRSAPALHPDGNPDGVKDVTTPPRAPAWTSHGNLPGAGGTSTQSLTHVHATHVAERKAFGLGSIKQEHLRAAPSLRRSESMPSADYLRLIDAEGRQRVGGVSILPGADLPGPNQNRLPLHKADYEACSGLSRTHTQLTVTHPQLASFHTADPENYIIPWPENNSYAHEPAGPGAASTACKGGHSHPARERALGFSMALLLHGAQPHSTPRRPGTPAECVRKARDERDARQRRRSFGQPSRHVAGVVTPHAHGAAIVWAPGKVSSSRRGAMRIARPSATSTSFAGARTTTMVVRTGLPYHAKKRAQHRAPPGEEVK